MIPPHVLKFDNGEVSDGLLESGSLDGPAPNPNLPAAIFSAFVSEEDTVLSSCTLALWLIPCGGSVVPVPGSCGLYLQLLLPLHLQLQVTHGMPCHGLPKSAACAAFSCYQELWPVWLTTQQVAGMTFGENRAKPPAFTFQSERTTSAGGLVCQC